MLIGGDDISNDVITLGACFAMFVYIPARFCFVLIGGFDSLVDEEPQGNWRWNSNSSLVAIALLPFPALPPECPGELTHRIVLHEKVFQSTDNTLSP